MSIIASFILVIIFSIIGLIHVYWVFGGEWGLVSAMPDALSKKFMSNARSIGFKIATMIVAVGLFAMAYLFLIHSKFVVSPFAPSMIKYGTYAVIAIFGFRAIGDFRYCGFFKSIKEGNFAANDTKYYSPLCLLISILSFAVILL